MDVKNLNIKDIQNGYMKKDFTVKEVINGYLDSIEKEDEVIGSFINIDRKSAIKKAMTVDEEIKNKEDINGLMGIPIALNDDVCTKDMPTTCGSKMLEDFTSPYDATVVKKLKSAGAIIIGKTNMDEFGLGSTTENSFYKTTKNPWNIKKVPGGSAGGAAAAIASGFVPLALASDYDGSLRQAASFCGIVGLKPTYGLVSRYGLISPTSSLSQIGIMSKNVEDCALVLEIIQGSDSMDSTSYKAKKNKDYTSKLKNEIRGLKVGIPIESFNEDLDPEIENKIDKIIDVLNDMDIIVEKFSMGNLENGLLTHYMIMSAEVSSNLSRYDGIRYGYQTKNFNTMDELMRNSRSEAFGEEIKRRITLGGLILTSKYYDKYYYNAKKIAEEIKRECINAFKSYDLILMPSSPVLPYDIGMEIKKPLDIYRSKLYTVIANITGLPSMSLPCGFSSNGLPIGLELMTDYFNEDKLLNMAYHLRKKLVNTPGLEEL